MILSLIQIPNANFRFFSEMFKGIATRLQIIYRTFAAL